MSLDISTADSNDDQTSDGDVNSLTSEEKRSRFNEFSVCAYVITIVIGGQYYNWTVWLKCGFGMVVVAQMLIASAYFIYVSSIAEIVSGFPFSGGGYGLARVAQGYYIGFLVGCTEALEYIAFTALSFLYVSELMCSLFNIDSQYSIIFCFLCYVVFGSITIYGGQALIYTNYALAFVSLSILLMFCFCSFHLSNFAENASLHLQSPESHVNNWFHGGMPQFMAMLPDLTTAYAGVEAICLLPALTNNPRTNLPKGIIMGMCILFVTSVLMLFVMASQPGGLVATSHLEYPMKVGFELIFRCPRWVTLLLMLPAQIGQAVGFMLPYAKLLQALGTTNLLPRQLQLNNCNDHTNGVIVGSVFGFCLCVVCEYYEGENLSHICILAGFLTYLSQLHGYWILKRKHTQARREFVSPFGLVGVIFAAVVFVLGIIAVCAFTRNYVAVSFMLLYLLLLSIYYHVCAAKTQTIAKEEQAILFQLHVAKQNRRRKKRPVIAKKQPRTMLKARVVAACVEEEIRASLRKCCAVDVEVGESTITDNKETVIAILNHNWFN